MDETGREREKKILVPNSVHTRPRKENSEKKLVKKYKKLKNFFPTLFLARTGWDWARRGEKNFSPEFRSYSTPEKKWAKKFKKLKNFFPALFLARTGWDWARRGEKNFSPEFRSYSTPERKFRKKISKKIQKIKKLLSSIIFSQNEMKLGEKVRKNF